MTVDLFFGVFFLGGWGWGGLFKFFVAVVVFIVPHRKFRSP